MKASTMASAGAKLGDMFAMLSRSKALTGAGVLALILAQVATATELSRNLSEDDIVSATKILTQGSQHHAWTAHGLESGGLGMDIGVEASFLPRQDLLDQGDGSAVIPRITPVPRLWLSWDLPMRFMVSASIAPGGLFDGVAAYGFGGQFSFYRNDSIATTASFLIDYTYSDAFGDLRAHTTGVAAQISRDLFVWQPYFGAGFIVSNSTLRAALAAPGVDPGPHTVAQPHFYLGARVDLIAKVSFQLDLYGAKPTISLLLANAF